MPRRDSTPSTSPLVPPESQEEIATISHHDSIGSAHELTVAGLNRKIKELQANEAGLIQSVDQLSQELKTCKNDLIKEKQEAHTFAGKLSKESRNSSALSREMDTLRADTGRKVRDIETKLDHEKKEQAKNQQAAKKTIADLHSQLDAKQSTIEELEARVPDKKCHPHATQAEMLVAGDTAYHPPSSLTGKPNTNEPSPIQASIIPKLHDSIKYLQKENARLQNIHHENGCEEYRNLIFQQLQDAKELQAAAEAETEGLRHLSKANAGLMDQDAVNVKRIKELVQEKDRYCVKIEQPLEAAEELLVEQRVISGLTKPDAASSLPQSLGFFAVACFETAPIALEDNKAEISEYMRRLHGAELEVEALTLEKNHLSSDRDKMEAQLVNTTSTLDALKHQQTPLSSAVFCLPSEPKVASSNKSSLTCSGLHTVSTTSRTPVPASTPFTNPTLLAELGDLGKSIMSLSTVPPPKVVIKPSTTLHTTPLLPNVALTINIQPTDKRNYSLLQRVQSAISATSSLDIHGPREVVKQFVASMYDVETDHAEKSKLATQLEKDIKQYRADIEALEAQLRDKRKCIDPEHRMMADELEAKNVQFAMQEQLLADWGKRNG